MHDRVVGIAGRIKHLRAGPSPCHLVGELAAVDAAGHDDVGEQQVEALAVVDNVSAVGPSAAANRPVAEALQLRDDEASHQRVVFHHQDGLVPRDSGAAAGIATSAGPRAGGR